MFKYEKKLAYPVNIKKKDLKMAKALSVQLGGPDSELSAALRYFLQRTSMPDEKGFALLTDIATEELGHLEMIQAMICDLIKGATPEEMKEAGLIGWFTEHNKGTYAMDPNGNPWTAAYIGVTGNPIADLVEDMAAEQKAKVTYENLMELTNDTDILAPLSFLRQREVVHFNRFKELYEYYQKKYDL